MKTSTAAALGAAFAVGTALLPISAGATCTQTIYAERSVSNGATTQILGRNSSTAVFGYFGTTPNIALQDAISAAVSQRNRVTVTGSAATCPTAPLTGFRNLGTINAVIISP
jgi:hypothetical protein